MYSCKFLKLMNLMNLDIKLSITSNSVENFVTNHTVKTLTRPINILLNKVFYLQFSQETYVYDKTYQLNMLKYRLPIY